MSDTTRVRRTHCVCVCGLSTSFSLHLSVLSPPFSPLLSSLSLSLSLSLSFPLTIMDALALNHPHNMLRSRCQVNGFRFSQRCALSPTPTLTVLNLHLLPPCKLKTTPPPTIHRNAAGHFVPDPYKRVHFVVPNLEGCEVTLTCNNRNSAHTGMHPHTHT